MSKARRVPDFERTATMLDLVHRIYPEHYPHGRAMGLSHVVIEECAPGTGWRHVNRYADVLALSVWPSKGLTLDGYEIKASRTDLKKELADLSKHEAIARYCDTWTLVVWDESLLIDGIPEEWGILTTKPDDHDGRALVEKRKPRKRTPDPWPRQFVCALVRNAFEQAPGAAYIARACFEAGKRGHSDGKCIENMRWKAAVTPLARAIYGQNQYKWPPEAFDPEHLIKVAVERLAQETLKLEVSA